MQANENTHKPSFLRVLRRWAILSPLTLAAILLTGYTINSYREAGLRAEEMRSRYMSEQRGLIKNEVNSAVRIIDHEIKKSIQDTRELARDRVYNAYSIAKHIYDQNAGRRSVPEIQKLIIDALRPIRFDKGSDYYFLSDFNGIVKLLPAKPDLEGTSLFDNRDARGNYHVRDSIDIARNQGEGYVRYYWTKADQGDQEFQKIAYIKRFEPFDWYIGTGVYFGMVETRMQHVIAHYTGANRFGANGQGYVFVIELLDINGGDRFGRIYANPNRVEDIGKFVSDEYKDARGKTFRKAYLKGLREDGECYVDYWYSKIDDPKPSPKTSFFKLAGNGRFIVGAGVYLDDIEAEIGRMQTDLHIQLQQNFFIVGMIFAAAIILSMALINFLGTRLKSDFDLFIRFFQRATDAAEFIQKQKIRYGELDQLAEWANRMLTKKAKIEDALRKKHAHLEHLFSEQNRTEGELRKSEEKYRILVENANDAIYIEQEGMLKFCNPVTEKLTGYSQEELSVRPLPHIVHPDDRDAIVDLHEACLTSDKPVPIFQPFRIARKDGAFFWVQASLVRLEWEDKPATLGFLRDVTEQKELEKKMIQGQKLEAIGTLAGGIAHDFNNILSGLIGYTQLALYEVEEMPATKKKLGHVLKAAERATDLIKQILSFSRSQKIERKPINPLTITREVLRLIRATIPANIEIKQSLRSQGCVLADATHIHQILMNLCTNAAYAMRGNGGVLSVGLQDVTLGKEDLSHHLGMAPGAFLKISVEDTGTGMTREVQEKAFDPFYTTKDPGEGSGMGLASVHGITADLGGFMSLYSEPGQGTSMHVFIPLIDDAAEIDEYPKENERLEGGTERILFVDDEPTQRGLAEAALSKYGYHVVTFGDSAAAKAHFQQDPQAYDLLITDMTMPNMTGDVLTQKIHLIRPDIPVIMCTGYSEVIDEEKAKALEIDAFLYKPVIIAEMLGTIREVLDR